ncbi:MAG: DsbA family protein [Alphaproteobacteria bacterium]|nr:DsbA family protein [Alphaproteobacteria bacterium]
MTSFLICICLSITSAMAALLTPVSVQIVTSLSCPHCAENHDTTKALIDEYTNDGKIIPTWVDYPTDLATLTATKLSWSHGDEKRYELYKQFLVRQNEWHNADWRAHLKKIATELGMNEQSIQQCFEDNTENEKTIVATLQKVVEKHDLQFVPVLIVDDRLVVDLDKKSLDKALKEVEKNRDGRNNQEKNTQRTPLPPRIIEKQTGKEKIIAAKNDSIES